MKTFQVERLILNRFFASYPPIREVGLAQLAGMKLTREELLMRLGAARKQARTAWRLMLIEVASASATLSYRLDRDKLRQVRRREGRYLLRTNLVDDDPARLWGLYLQLVSVDIDQAWRLSRLKGWRGGIRAGKQVATEWKRRCSSGFEAGDGGRVRRHQFGEDSLNLERAAA